MTTIAASISDAIAAAAAIATITVATTHHVMSLYNSLYSIHSYTYIFVCALD